MGRTKISTLGAVAVVTLGCGWLLLALLDRRGTYLSPVPWLMTPVLLVIAVSVLWAASSVRAYLRGKRPSLNPLRAARTAALSKAAALAGALLAGWYGSQVVLTFAHLHIESQQARAWSAGAACAAGVALAVAGVVGERFCQLPPPSDAEVSPMGEDGVHD